MRRTERRLRTAQSGLYVCSYVLFLGVACSVTNTRALVERFKQEQTDWRQFEVAEQIAARRAIAVVQDAPLTR